MLGVNYVGIHFKALKHRINTSMRSVMIKLIKTFSTNGKLDSDFWKSHVCTFVYMQVIDKFQSCGKPCEQNIDISSLELKVAQ
jgi:hypothetical protein